MAGPTSNPTTCTDPDTEQHKGPSQRSASIPMRPSVATGVAPLLATGPVSSATSVSSQSPIEFQPLPSTAEIDVAHDTLPARPAKSRPSLAERTIETLSQLPSSPALSKKSSSFFDPDGSRRPRSRAESNASRPGSSYASDASSFMRPASRGRSRPGSSSGPDDGVSAFRASTNTFRRPMATIEGTPSRRTSGIASLRTPSVKAGPRPATASSTRFSASTTRRDDTRSPSPATVMRPSGIATPSKVVSATVGARTSRARGSVNGLFKKRSLPSIDRAAAQSPTTQSSLKVVSRPRTAAPPRRLKNARTPAKKTPIKKPTEEAAEAPETPSLKSSAALRDQIAKAKAAKRAAVRQLSNAPQLELDSDSTLPVQEEDRWQPPKSPIVPSDHSFDFGLPVAVTDDPFNIKRSEKATDKILRQRLADARTSGRLNIATLGFKAVPLDVLKMYDAETTGTYDGSWAESVDVTKFVAADNEFEEIDDAIFPDVTPEELGADEDGNGNIFAGLETLDLHGNMLISLPVGLRQLRLLTSLNLSSNRLANNCLEVISQISSLRDLKLPTNLLYGPLDPCISNLRHLEILDLHGNNLSSLPVNIGNLERLRILNISDNSVECLPFSSLSKMPLFELWAKNNKLTGTLIEEGVRVLPNLQSLDVSCNQITHLVAPGSAVDFPALYQLFLSMNRLQALPDASSWTNLVTLTADENSISSFPDGLFSLEKLRHIDVSSNDIKAVPPEIARMDSLSMIRLSGNPLREKKLVSATTEELKDILSARLEPPPPYCDVTTTTSQAIAPELVRDVKVAGEPARGSTENKPQESARDEGDIPEDRNTPTPTPSPTPTSTAMATADDADDAEQDSRSDMDDFATPPTSAPHTPARSRSHTVSSQTWPVKVGGLLDRSNTGSASLHPVVCSKVAAATKVYEVQLHHNLFTAIPDSLSFFAETLSALSLAHNKLVGETYLTEELELPALRELNLMGNHITSLTPLTTHLRSPRLEKLDVSVNRITGLPGDLRTAFPQLVVLLAANNHIMDLDPDTIKGLQVVDVGSNDITHLNPKLGLLGGSGGLKRLEVAGNRFRVPRWSVLERGTDATLRWLRGRVPVAEMASWKENQAESGGYSDSDVD
ncbi:L domain-like protein [Sodiomyces alkalinus F11]|uniref:L domain-like protein n=1 Tax=Sodiomyces alkalinus (strain CBS 110278 / VKM F-3762 / F11) TaxID=1314773 RepID=A0A3N2Q7C0_SODAK|nr:L domain-like protein [Sodiomyces alkalinus F11]ROT42642.1 L domain-like protein [Sodiomyces alkalinus F11]